MSREKLLALAFVLPCILVLLFVGIFPLVYSLALSFCRYEMLRQPGPTFVGLKNYAHILLKDKRFYGALGRTFLYMAVAVPVEFGLGLLIALLLNKEFFGRRALVTLFMLPMVLAPIVASFMFVMLYDEEFGPFDHWLRVLGFGIVKWCSDPNVSLWSIILCDIWQWTPFMIVVLFSGLQALPREPYEAAEIDGASSWQILRYVTFPMMKPIIAVAVLIRMMDVFKCFDYVYMLTQGGPGTSSEVIAYYTYLVAFRFFRMGYASALSYIQLIIIIALTTLLIRLLARLLRA